MITETMTHMGLLALRLGSSREENAEIVRQIYAAMKAVDPRPDAKVEADYLEAARKELK